MYFAISSQAIPDILPSDLFAADGSHGAEVIFRGLIRNQNQGRQVVALSYDAFAPLAERMFRTISEEAKSRWGSDLRVTVIHRVGHLTISECAVVVALSARHRQEAYAASQYVIENLKHRAPIWKKEHYVDGDSEWLEGHALCGHSKADSRSLEHSHSHN